MDRCPRELLATCRNESPREPRSSISDILIDEDNISYCAATFPDARGTIQFNYPVYIVV